MTQTGRVLAVCGMPMEAAIARGEGVETLCSAARPDALRRKLAERLGADDIIGVVSFGIAGGLHPGVRAGSLVVASWIGHDADRRKTHEEWRRAVLSAAPQAIAAGIVGADAILPTAAGKAHIRSATDAAAIDTESHIVAELAEHAGLPFAAIRAVADPAGFDLPPAAQVALRADGRPDFPRVLRSLAREPAQLGALIGTARHTTAALASLRRFRRNLAPGLGFPDFRELVLDVP
jgi:adenosylhomocysteine nucleosidase